MSNKSAKITPSPVPPHHQSTVEKMACHRFYVEDQIKRRKKPGGMESARGIQIHRTMARYAAHCARRQVSMDLDAFEEFRKGAGPAAAKILANLRDGYKVDYGHFFASEIPMCLTAGYEPTHLADMLQDECEEVGGDAHFMGTLDALYFFRAMAAILIEDFKSHAKPFKPDDTMQGTEYAVFCFQHFPWVETITFRLVFVRYQNCVRETTYVRSNLPKLLDDLRTSRDLQFSIHQEYDAGSEIQATPGPHCVYCPLLSDRTCPISEFNEQMQLSLEDRLRWNIWHSEFSKVNNAVLRNHLQATGRNVVIYDGNGRPCVFGPVPGVSKVYPVFLRDSSGNGIAIDHQNRPVLPIIDKFMDYAHEEPSDTEWMLKLRISSTQLNQPLSTKKRVHLDQSIKDDVFVVSAPKLTVTWPKEVETDEDEPEEEEDEE